MSRVLKGDGAGTETRTDYCSFCAKTMPPWNGMRAWFCGEQQVGCDFTKICEACLREAVEEFYPDTAERIYGNK